ncbi:MAG: hypothetical protein MJY77_09085, partial [Bacteroidaceae bacterium]|nr:hypothetical protein [Bacteroidaceae bacterium]
MSAASSRLAFIPATYIKNELQNLDVYKRIAAIDGEESYSEMEDELIDRFGDIPKAAKNLLDIALLRAKAHEADIVSLKHRDKEILVMLYKKARKMRKNHSMMCG